MAQQVNTLPWTATGDDKQGYVALIAINIAVDTVYNIAVTTSVQGSDKQVIPKFLTVDNVSNNGIITLEYGGMLWTVPQYQRLTFTLPDNSRFVKVSISAGNCNVWFAEKQPASDVTNQLLVQQTAVKTLIYGYVPYSVGPQNQNAADQNSNVLFTPTIADMNYNLLAISGNVGNGWFQFIQNRGNKIVSIIPNGGDTLNGVFNSAFAMKLNPGDSGYLSSDGVTWYFNGGLSWEGAEHALTGANNVTESHQLGKVPTIIQGFFRCKTAEQNWLVGDEINFSWQRISIGAANAQGLWTAATTTQILQNLLAAGAATFVLFNKTTGAAFNLTNANWVYFLRARAEW